jgi:hypothetical protein
MGQTQGFDVVGKYWIVGAVLLGLIAGVSSEASARPRHDLRWQPPSATHFGWAEIQALRAFTRM